MYRQGHGKGQIHMKVTLTVSQEIELIHVLCKVYGNVL